MIIKKTYKIIISLFLVAITILITRSSGGIEIIYGAPLSFYSYGKFCDGGFGCSPYSKFSLLKFIFDIAYLFSIYYVLLAGIRKITAHFIVKFILALSVISILSVIEYILATKSNYFFFNDLRAGFPVTTMAFSMPKGKLYTMDYFWTIGFIIDVIILYINISFIFLFIHSKKQVIRQD